MPFFDTIDGSPSSMRPYKGKYEMSQAGIMGIEPTTN